MSSYGAAIFGCQQRIDVSRNDRNAPKNVSSSPSWGARAAKAAGSKFQWPFFFAKSYFKNCNYTRKNASCSSGPFALLSLTACNRVQRVLPTIYGSSHDSVITYPRLPAGNWQVLLTNNTVNAVRLVGPVHGAHVSLRRSRQQVL
jgi:hypothetical protein